MISALRSALRGTLLSAVASVIASSTVAAQDPPQPLVTRTIPLRHLRAVDAARLVSPYVRAPHGGVYDAGDGVQAVTVVESAPVVARIDSLIRANDRSPAVLVFRFQLIAAEDTSTPRDPAIDSLDATLRSLFRFRGYRLLGHGTTTAGESEDFSLTVAADKDRFRLIGDVVRVEAESGSDAGSVRLRVRLAHVPGSTSHGKDAEATTLLSTGLTVPIGQTVVLGSAAPGGQTRALILTVRPEVAIPSRQ